ncbi:MAG: amino acid adenylation domain-containing protein [Saccharofermentans sp.]|nr:amino acid adenylation domain-containing protein [Saccharofermentans sp.]
MSNRLYELNDSQYGVYLECINDPENMVYNISLLCKLSDDIDPDRMKDSLEKAAAAHPLLNSRITKDSYGNIFLEASNEPVKVRTVELSDEEFEARKGSLNSPFDLEKDILSRFVLYRTPSGCYIYEEIHHLVYDGTSSANFARDVGKAYRGEEIAMEIPASPQRSEDAEDAAYFDELLGGIEGESAPERDNWDDTPVQKVMFREFEIDEAAFKSLRDAAGCSRTAFFVAAGAYVTTIYAGRDDALISTVWNGRNESNKDNVGMFVKTLPFTAQAEDGESVADYLSKATSQIKATQAHSAYSYVDIAGKYDLKNQVNIVYQGTRATVMLADGFDIELERVFDENAIESTLLILEIIQLGGGRYEILARYRGDYYTGDYIDSFVRTYIKILKEFLTKKELKDVQFLDEEEEKILDGYNATETDIPDTDIVTMFRSSAAKHKDKTAVVCGDESFTYEQVDDLSDRIACYIASKGLGKDDAVSVLIPRNTYMVIASLGVLKAGCAYQPLDAGYPTQRLTYMMNDASVRLMIASHDLVSKVPEYKGDILYIDDIPSLPKAENLPAGPSSSDLFILLYTSGTTGNPKGVMLEHHNIVNYCYWGWKFFGLTEESKVAAYASYGFDANMHDLYPTLTIGGTVYVIPEEMRLNLMGIEEYFEQNGVTHVLMTTQVGRQFQEMYKGTTLKVLSVGGERLVPIEPSPDHLLANGYGPTETTVGCTFKAVDKLYFRVPVGPMVDNAKAYITDKYMRRLPTGALGELCIAGNGVSRGYLNLPDKTAAVYTPNPFNSNKMYNRIYHSGDVVRMLPGGDIDFIGRNDGQVKIRGFRIELSEVEAEIRKFPGIKDCTVQAFDNPAGGKFIAAYLVSDGKIDTSALADHIKVNKPSYMVPQVMMQIDSIPLNRNQKVDKRALPAPVLQAEDFVKPSTDTQKKIFDITSSVLGHESFGINTDLMDAGLTSISLMKLMVKLSESFSTSLRIKDIKDNPTIEGLEKLLDSGKSSVRSYDILPDYPITKTQEGVLVECMSNPGTVIYNIPVLLKLDKSVDLDKLESAVTDTVNCHPYMKTHLFTNKDGDFRAKRRDDEPVAIKQIQMESSKINVKDLMKPFDLMNNDLYRIVIIESDDNYLFMDIHHIIADGESYEVIVKDIEKAYNGGVLTKEEYSGFDIAIDEMHRRESEDYTSAKEYYERLLGGVETDHLPPFDVASGDPGYGTCVRSSSIDMKAVKAFLDANELSENALFSGAFGFLLSMYNNKTDALYTTIYNGRSDVALMNAVDMLVKTLPIYVKTDDSIKITDYIKGVSDQFMNNLQNDIYSFAEISHEFGVTSDVMFAWQGSIMKNDTIGGKHAEILMPELDLSKFKLYVYASVDGDSYTLSSEYQPNLYSKVFIEWMLRNLEQVITEFITKDTLGDVKLLSSETEDEIEKFNDTSVPVEDTDIVTLFRRAAKEHGDNLAVVCGDESFTYSQVDDMSDRIASYVAGKGLGAGDAVSVLIPRCAYMVPASLGVLKAGCAYQPLDPGYPEDRLQYMTKDAGVRLIIADRSLMSKIPSYEGEVLYLDEIEALPAADKTLPAPKPSDLFILLYTSGTTGVPKGVMLEHHNLVNFCKWYQRYMGVTAESKAAAYASYGFDANMMDLYPALTIGATVYIIPEDMRLNLIEIQDYFEKNGVTHSFMTTQVGRQFREMYQGTTLKCLSVGGERLVPIGPADGYRFINGYGPTECTIFSTTKEVDADYHRIPIGKPIDNYKVYVIAKNGRRLPVGLVGELCISGAGVGRGYLNMPDKTAQIFTPNPFTDEKGYERIYHTGDIVRLLPNGDIDFIGRNDGQVKIRGFRIELAEVEHVIREHPEIKDVTVQVFDDPGGGKYIAAYVVSDHKINIDSLRSFIGERKPSYMIPAAIMQIDSIPLNQNQKVNKRALPVIERRSEEVYEEPKTTLEREVCTLFADILSLARVGATDNFFEIGGSSILAAKIIVHAMNKGYKIVYKDVFDNPTPRQLAKVIGGARSDEKGSRKQLQADDYDYSKINEFIARNTMENVTEITYGKLGNIILTGATGFLGMHVLKSFIDSNDGIAYCLMRKGRYPSPEKRLMSMLSYYFEDPMIDKIGKRIICVEGDITDPAEINKLKGFDADVLINCAACVKHFVEDDLLDKVNYHGVQNLIDFCLENNIRLVQTSTYSVAGELVLDETGIEKEIYENQLYFGQGVENDYVRTKFLAERAVLEARVTRGLNACIVRMGNLMSRYSDGEFQINFLSNAFMRSLKAYKSLGQFPFGALDRKIEFSPIDTSAAAVLKFATADSSFSVFHGYNNHTVTFADVIYAMKNYGFDIAIVSDEEFGKTVAKAAESSSSSDTILSLVAYNSKDGNRSYMLGANNRFSMNALLEGGFKWPIIDDNYLANAIEKLDMLMFFDNDEETGN